MNKEEQILLELLKSSLFDIPARIPADTDWNAVLKEAAAQTVLAIAAEAVPEEHRARWKRSERFYIANTTQKAYAERELLALFREHEIPLVILKGSAAAVYYPIPFRRWMGDIDFIVPKERFAEAKALLCESGYFLPEADGCPTREFAIYKDGIKYELHYRFSDSDLDIETYVTKGLQNPAYGEIEGYSFPMLPALENGLVLLAHLRHHLQTGMGLRQMIDWMMYVHRELDDVYWQTHFEKEAKKTGLDVLAVVATRMCQKYLGLRDDIHWCMNAEDELCEVLLNSLLSSGNFGNKHGTGQRVEKIATTIRKEGIFHYFQRAGETNWKAYHRHKWLKPFCWVYQVFRYIKQRMATGRANIQLLDDINRSKKRYELMQKLNIK